MGFRRAMNVALTTAMVMALGSPAAGADWPMYRADAGRTGYTADQLPTSLSLCWVRKSPHPPEPAWPAEPRMPFDRVYQPVIAGGTLYFGSSADGKVYALDAATGATRWMFFTGAPIRFAPAVDGGRVFVASDDGHLYCLSAKDGTLLWKCRPAPTGAMVLGNGRMVSQRPIRGGPAVLDGVVYVAAGIFPADGTSVHALNAATGKTVWVNETVGSVEHANPHAGPIRSGIGFQGYLAVAGDRVFAPTGRAMPASFNRADGTLQYFFFLMKEGGTDAVAFDSYLAAAGYLLDAKSQHVVAPGIPPAAVAVSPDWLVYAQSGSLVAVDRAVPVVQQEVVSKDAKRTQTALNVKWRATIAEAGEAALIVAGGTVISSGGRTIVAVDAATKAVVWKTEVDGPGYGLAVADGRLYVSTTAGTIYCFGDGEPNAPAAVAAEPETAPFDDHRVYAEAADAIIKKTGITEGYCLDLGCGDGRLALELAARTDLRIYAIDADPQNVAAARRALDAAGLYGVRVTVHQGNPARTPYPKYFANLIVSGRSVTEGAAVVPAAEVERLQRPFGGVACFGRPPDLKTTTRGPLDGAGQWTHQYANPGNTGCSDDTLVKGPLGTLWFGPPSLEMPDRHGRPPAPVCVDGRLYVPGLNALYAVDAYNGHLMWTFPLPGLGKAYDQDDPMGAAGTGGVLCASPDSVYARTGSMCIRVDALTGKERRVFETPERPDGTRGAWGFVACDKGVLFGSVADEKHLVPYRFRKAEVQGVFTESASLFAVEPETGTVKWTYTAAHSIRHNAIAIGGGRVYLIDRAAAAEQPRGGDVTQPQPTGRLLGLDAATGGALWQTDEDVYGTVLLLSTQHDVLVMCYQRARFALPSEIGGRLAGFRASDGRRLWDIENAYGGRPIVNDRTVYLDRAKVDLLTGEVVRWRYTRKYGCGVVTASRHLLLFRSGCLGYVDLARNRDTEHFGGLKPGCWLNAIPVGGIVVMPDYTEKCTCSYLNKTAIALQTME